MSWRFADRWQVCAEGLPRRGVVQVHHHICPDAKFQQNRTIRGRVIAIKLIKDGRRSPYWMFKRSIPHVGGPHCLHTRQIWWSAWVNGRDIPPKLSSKQRPPGGGILLSVSISTHLQHLHMCDDKKISEITRRSVTAPHAPSLTKVSHFCHSRQSADPETPKMAELHFPSRICCRFRIGSPVSYSSFRRPF